MELPKVKISEFDYNLPEERIAKYPLEQRDMSKLLIYDNGKISDDTFFNLPKYIDAGSTLVANNSKVIPARLIFRKPTGARIEVFCLEPAQGFTFETIFSAKGKVVWKAIIGNAKKWKSGSLQRVIKTGHKEFLIKALLIDKLGDGTYVVEFNWDADLTFAEVMEFTGKVPIPPYLRRETEEIDKTRYQTVYAKVDGSVAAPTAGLHFTDRVFNKLRQKNIGNLEVTLHVSAGTFKPVDDEDLKNHKIHEEIVVISKETLTRLANETNTVSVGTTTLRTLESIYWAGINIKNGKPLSVRQWQPYETSENLSFTDAINILGEFMGKNNLEKISFPTEIIIMPGYKVKSVSALITNFHQPRSTLLLLVAALIGDDWKCVYEYALTNNFRFLSYGDSSILKFDKL